MRYLKIANTSHKANCLLKNDIKSVVGQADFELLIKVILYTFTLKIWMSFFCFRIVILFLNKCVDKFEIAHKTCPMLVLGEFPS